MYAKDPFDSKYQFLINKGKYVGVKHFQDPKPFIECSSDMQDFYHIVKERNPEKRRKELVLFDDMIADMISIKILHPTVTKLLIRGREINITLIFISQSYFTE